MAIELHEPLTQSIIGAAIEVHRHLGPGLLESVYERALAREMTLQGIPFAQQIGIPLRYKGELISEHRPDFVVASLVVLEVKSVERFDPVHTAQVLTYLRVTRLRVGLLGQLQDRGPEERHPPNRAVIGASLAARCDGWAPRRRPSVSPCLRGP